jgi:alcohol dehydrogenase class IV
VDSFEFQTTRRVIFALGSSRQLPALARDAMLQQRLLVNNPREVTEADALRLYEEAYG